MAASERKVTRLWVSIVSWCWKKANGNDEHNPDHQNTSSLSLVSNLRQPQINISTKNEVLKIAKYHLTEIKFFWPKSPRLRFHCADVPILTFNGQNSIPISLSLSLSLWPRQVGSTRSLNLNNIGPWSFLDARPCGIYGWGWHRFESRSFLADWVIQSLPPYLTLTLF